MKRWSHAGISKVEIERIGKVIRFTIWTARPGVVIGKGGTEIQKIREEIQALTGSKVMINVQEIKTPDKEAQIVSEGVASALERRVSFRRAMKQSIFRAMKSGAQGIKIQCSGRLGGAEIARTEWYLEGRLPLSTLRADIDYGFAEALTTFGKIGVKVWIFQGMVYSTDKNEDAGTLVRKQRHEREGGREGEGGRGRGRYDRGDRPERSERREVRS